MALYKPIKQDNGITLSYHRVWSVQSTINRHSSIAVKSYVDEESRKTENEMDVDKAPYTKVVTYETDYIENMTAEAAYEYLKTLPIFEGATNI